MSDSDTNSKKGGAMKKLVAGLVAAVLVDASASFVLWFQLRAERERGAAAAGEN